MIKCAFCDKDLQHHTETQTDYCLKKISTIRKEEIRPFKWLTKVIHTPEECIEIEIKSMELQSFLLKTARETKDEENVKNIFRVIKLLSESTSSVAILMNWIDLYLFSFRQSFVGNE